ncbi:MAG: restriction endonuclease subunit S [Roseburia sp.]|nr:restriction endonuclease subunit S [Roseburia sp.]MCM1097560.1 restriction endonuclease subunit S [Ruminococcus flavefaciens]MCM1234514.1 restriction endonuclease subunit S [Ruminococcus flavefaciens]
MKLDIQAWKPFLLYRLYDIRMGNKFDKNKLDADVPEINLVSRISNNNGVDVKVGYVEGINPFPAGCITVALGGSLGSCFVQEESFYTAQNVAVMTPRESIMTHAVNMFISSLVRYESKMKYYAFGRELNTHIKTDFDVTLPVQHNSDGTPIIDTTYKWSEDGYIPDWQFMENYIKSLRHEPLTTKNNSQRAFPLNIKSWKEFRFGDLISNIYKAKAINKDYLTVAFDTTDSIRYITRTGEDNGCEMLAVKSELSANIIEEGNAISIGDTTATCFYQDEEFITGDHMVVVRADSWLNKYTGLFVAAILQGEQYKYSYGRAYLIDRIKDTVMKLPVDKKGNPDWKFMESYIKSLPYGDRLEG